MRYLKTTFKSFNESNQNNDFISVKQIIVSKLKLNDDQIWEKHTTEDKILKIPKICINLLKDNANQCRAMLDLMEQLGWFLADIMIDFFDEDTTECLDLTNKEDVTENTELYFENDEDGESEMIFYFEPYYSDILPNNEKPDFLYHVTDEKYLEAILSEGLKPKTESKIAYHPERVYFLLNQEDVKLLLDHPKFIIDDPILLKIDIRGVKTSLKLHHDPNLPNAVYTTQKIEPGIITVVVQNIIG